MNDITLLRMPELTKKLGVSRSSVYKMIKERGFPPPVKLGRIAAWRLSDVAAYLNEDAPDPSLLAVD